MMSCDDDYCYCIEDVEKLNEKIDQLNVKLEELTDDVKDLKEFHRTIMKGHNKPLQKMMENYMDNVLDYRLSDFRRDIRDLTDDMAELQRKVEDNEKQTRL